MCCLTFEHEMYHKVQENFPKIGAKVTTRDGKGKWYDIMRCTIGLTVRLENGEEIETEVDKIIGD